MPGCGDSYILERNVIIKAVVIRCRLLRRGLLRLRGGLRLGRGTLRAGLAHALFATALTAVEQLHLTAHVDHNLGGRRARRKR